MVYHLEQIDTESVELAVLENKHFRKITPEEAVSKCKRNYRVYYIEGVRNGNG